MKRALHCCLVLVTTCVLYVRVLHPIFFDDKPFNMDFFVSIFDKEREKYSNNLLDNNQLNKNPFNDESSNGGNIENSSSNTDEEIKDDSHIDGIENEIVNDGNLGNGSLGENDNGSLGDSNIEDDIANPPVNGGIDGSNDLNDTNESSGTITEGNGNSSSEEIEDNNTPSQGTDDSSEKIEDSIVENKPVFTTSSSSGDERFEQICTFDEDGWVWCTQDSKKLGFSGGCFLTSYAMLIINAGRHVGTEKNYSPIDVYLANNYKQSVEQVSARHGIIAEGFNYKYGWIDVDINKSDYEKEQLVRSYLKDNPWGVIIGGPYVKDNGNNSTHYFVARLDEKGNLVFDEPARTLRENGAELSSLSKAWCIKSWANINRIMTIDPILDENGVWQPGTWELSIK